MSSRCVLRVYLGWSRDFRGLLEDFRYLPGDFRDVLMNSEASQEVSEAFYGDRGGFMGCQGHFRGF